MPLNPLAYLCKVHHFFQRDITRKKNKYYYLNLIQITKRDFILIDTIPFKI
jgi:hypothetical protein